MFRKDDCFEAGNAVVFADTGWFARDGAVEDVEVGFVGCWIGEILEVGEGRYFRGGMGCILHSSDTLVYPVLSKRVQKEF